MFKYLSADRVQRRVFTWGQNAKIFSFRRDPDCGSVDFQFRGCTQYTLFWEEGRRCALYRRWQVSLSGRLNQ